MATNDSSRFSPAERPVILAALEEFTNALAIHRSTLRKPTRENDILTDCLSFENEYDRSNEILMITIDTLFLILFFTFFLCVFVLQ